MNLPLPPQWGQSRPSLPTVCPEPVSIPAHPPAALLPGPWEATVQKSRLNVNQEFQERVTYVIWHEVQRDSSPNLASYILLLTIFSFFPVLGEWEGAGGCGNETHRCSHVELVTSWTIPFGGLNLKELS